MTKEMGSLKVSFICALITLCFLPITLLASIVSTGDFNNDFIVKWSPSHVTTFSNGQARTLKLDQESGSGSSSKDEFLFGQFDMQIKLIPGYSAGTVVTFYLQSGSEQNRDEIDIEFLGNVTGQPYILQTNIYTNGFADREERIYLWFDPTKDFTTYSVMWNIHQIVFMVNSTPIRTFRNYEDKGIPFPLWKAMNLFITLWDGDTWATRGGRDKIDWSKGPFIASFKNYKIDACVWRGNNARTCGQNGPTNWWNNEKFSTLTLRQRRLLNWVRKGYLIYDYCQDKKRFHNNLPKECYLPKY